MKQNETDLSSKVAHKYTCEKCNYNTSKLHDYKKHLSTDKHSFSANETEMKQNVAKNLQCSCGIIFNNRTTLWRHKKKCKFENDDCEDKTPNTDTNKFNFITSELIIDLIKDNKEMKQIIFEQNSTISNLVKNGISNTNASTNMSTNYLNNSNNNCNNKTFNLQFFLNDTCKNAMNITDFVESIKLQLIDLEKFGELGYIEGISSIITSSLKAMDETLRPVHCTDKRREIVYIKDEDKWEKDDENKTKLKKVIKKVANKNIRLLPLFKEKHPDYNNSTSKYSDQYSKIVIESMGGNEGNDQEKENKIIHNISKCIIIDKYSELCQ
jgi:hypothetical protein